MSEKQFRYAGTAEDKAKAAAVVAFVEGGAKDLKGFRKRVVLSAAQIKRIRKGLSFTQGAFASVLHVDVTTVQGWEQGLRTADGPATAMMMLLPEHRQLVAWLTHLHKKTPAAT